MLVPLYGFVEGDTLGLLVLAHADWTISQVVDALGQSARLRAGETKHGILVFDNEPLSPDLTVASAGLLPLSRVDLRRPHQERS